MTSNRTTAIPNIPTWANNDVRPMPIVALNADGSTAVLGCPNESDPSWGSTTLLLANETFVSPTIDAAAYSTVILSVHADRRSAAKGVRVYTSEDASVWSVFEQYDYTHGGGIKIWTVQVPQNYLRVEFENGDDDQAVFGLTIKLLKTAGVVSSHRIDQEIEGTDDAALITGTIMARRLGDEGNIYENIRSTPEGDLMVSVVSPLGVLPVSQLTTLHDGKEINYEYTDIIETVGTGTGTFVDNNYQMSVAAGEYKIRQTRRFMPYYSGKPQKIELTFSNFAPQDGVIKRVGYFSSGTAAPYGTDFDGFWLESADDTIKIYAYRNGVPTINGVAINGWSNYRVLGSYQDMATWDNFTVVEFNFLWLGGAYIELRMMTESGWVTAHHLIPAGSLPSTFIKSPSQPVRYEIVSTTGAGDFVYVCNQVATSGSINESGRFRGVDTGETAIGLSAIGTIYPVLAVRKKPTMRDSAILVRSFDLFIASSDEGIWSLRKRPNILGGAFSWNDVPLAGSQFAIGNGTLTVDPLDAGIPIGTQNLKQGQTIPLEILERNFSAWLSSSITGTMDETVLCFEPATINCNVRASMGLLEV